MALAELHRDTPAGAEVTVGLGGWSRADLDPLLTGAGFRIVDVSRRGPQWAVRATRLRTLPDLIGPDLRLLVCGLNPSLFAADAGVSFARPGNRFWPAARAAGLVSRDRDPWHALRVDRVGFTDLVKRATTAAAELDPDEYRQGADRLRWAVGLVRPGALCFVGLAGWRAAVSKHAVPGPQPDGFAGVPAYLMPSTSGLNAHTKPLDFVHHLLAASRPGPGALSARS